jgi:anti-sigma B factor antagonist
MDITKTVDGGITSLTLSGRLDTLTSGELAKELDDLFAVSVEKLIFDFAALDYVSSAGLRVLLSAQKKISAAGAMMKIIGANDNVKEIFEITGFSSIMMVE